MLRSPWWPNQQGTASDMMVDELDCFYNGPKDTDSCATQREALQMVAKAAHCPQDLKEALSFLDGSFL